MENAGTLFWLQMKEEIWIRVSNVFYALYIFNLLNDGVVYS